MEEWLNNVKKINRFNIRVYGLVINDHNELLLCKEQLKGIEFTKFPGGGLEFGEGIKDCLIREFKEELNCDIDILAHFYTTDFFQQSAFINEDQIISIYYKVKLRSEILNYETHFENSNLHFHWKNLGALTENDITFPIDKVVLKMLL